MAITIPPLVVDYVIIYTALVALRPPGLFHPNGCPRAWGAGPEDAVVPAWLLALVLSLRWAAPSAI